MESQSNQQQIISENGELIVGFQDYVKACGIQNAKKDYNIVAIIGKQSSGKSTLLNNLFGTRFDVMNASQKRQQTTKGIYASADKEKNLFVLDVEGSDSKERWEGHGPFEQSTALFSLVFAQVLMINIWTQEVGRFTGSNYDILKVIFESNLKLFKQSGKKTLVFLLRDFTEDENEDEIKNTIKGDIDKIWVEIAKPKEYATSRPDNFFDMEFIFFSSYKFARNVFQTQANELRNRFVDSNSQGYFFKEFNYDNNVPIDGLGFYVNSIWTTIKECKDINLPNQRILVSTLRCTEIKAEVLTNAASKLEALKEKSKKALVDTYSIEGKAILNEATKSFSEQAEYYDKSVVSEKKIEIEKEILQNLYEGFENQVSLAKKVAVQEINNKLIQIVVNPNNCGGIMDTVNRERDHVVEKMKASILNAFLRDSEWPAERSIDEIKDQINGIVTSYKEKQLSYLLKQKQTEIRRFIEGTITNKLNNLDLNFWIEIANSYNESVRVVEDFIKSTLSSGLALDSDQIQQTIIKLNDEVYTDLETDIFGRFEEISNKVLQKFKSIFEKNDGIPINWKSLQPKEIENRYTDAKKNVAAIFYNLKIIDIPKRHDTTFEKKQVMKSSSWENIYTKLTDDMEYEFKEAIRKHNTSDISTIPRWFWIMLAYFMFDDVLRWINNPLILYPMAVLGGIIALMFIMGMGGELSTVFKSLFSILKAIIGPRLQKLGVNV